MSDVLKPVNGPPSHPLGNEMLARIAHGLKRFSRSWDFLIPAELLTDPEQTRRAKLVSSFGLLGTFFGIIYATFYLLIGHQWGALIIAVCSSGFALTSWLIRWQKSIELTAHFLILILTAGFTALCFVEGGLRGHAIAWLVSVPLCALLLLGQRAARRWAMAALLSASLVVTLDLAGIRLPVTYNAKWNATVSAAGYLGLIVFMFILGLIFETNRARAYSKMQKALGELAGANERLTHLNHEKNEFLGMAAHDLKNPLTIILGNAELAGMADSPGELNEFLSSIADAATRMNTLIGDLLDFNAIEEGRFTSNIQPCNLGQLVEESVRNNRPAAAKKRIHIHLEGAPDLRARACPAATVQILDNLISNALKYSLPGTTVRVKVRPEGSHAVALVRDEGPGISEEDQKNLFKKFTRLSARPTGGESSTGLGLAIVKRLAEAMSGTIQCESAPGQGATFILRLPVCAARGTDEENPLPKGMAQMAGK